MNYKRISNSELPYQYRNYSLVEINEESASRKLKEIEKILIEIKSIDSNIWKEIALWENI